jgi:hypothetical protein
MIGIGIMLLVFVGPRIARQERIERLKQRFERDMRAIPKEEEDEEDDKNVDAEEEG